MQELLDEFRQLAAADAVEAESETNSTKHDGIRKSVVPIAALSGIAMLVFSAIYLLTGGSPSPSPGPLNYPAAQTRESPSRSIGDLKSVKIQVLEGTADVYQNNQKIGNTPYELTERLGKHIDLVLRRAGFKDKRVEFSVTENKKEYTVSLDPENQ